MNAASPPVSESTTPAICGGGGASTPSPSRPELLEGYGSGGFPVRTTVALAQAYFSNGLQLATAFAHGPATAAMREAVRLDPNCAACLWGEALVSGPTLNFPVDENEVRSLAGLVAKARALAIGAPEKEAALIDALAARYPAGPGAYGGDKTDAANFAYAAAMDLLAKRWPEDDAIAVLTAEAWLIASLHGGDDTRLARGTELLEHILARSPNDTAALHYYIHATEWAGRPGKAEAAADRLPRFAPAASHLIHMPSHTFYRIGRYEDAVAANLAAAKLGTEDARLLGRMGKDAAWVAPYHLHNVHFGIGAALIVGDAESALELATPVLAYVQAPEARPFGKDGLLSLAAAYYAQGLFADPAAVMALPAPPAREAAAAGFWHYARGEAAARKADWHQVVKEAKAIRPPRDGSAAAQTLIIARHVLLGRAELLRARPDKALGHFQAAAELQERAGFTQGDPPPFWYPVRREVAAILLNTGRYGEALTAADSALRNFPKEPGAERIRQAAAASLPKS